ncbi:hypothetical protein [Dyella sp. A6]|uniref:hypothetical protein n=1 Tax=Dyella aluminiiresistens TaxID=3069105 RepID=UPI002E787FAA|nr:hypothetical protein [Dyella sp. A6]
MTIEVIFSGLAVLISFVSVLFSWLTATRANKISQVNTLIALRAYYLEESRRHTALANEHRADPSVFQSSACSSEAMAEKVRNIDAQLAKHYHEAVKVEGA